MWSAEGLWMAPPSGETVEHARQHYNLGLLQSDTELALGSDVGLPWRVGELAQVNGSEPYVIRKFDSGLTALVYQLRADGKDYALKLARPECLVRNVDGQTSFLNKLLCRQRIESLRAQVSASDRSALDAVTKTYVGSLRYGVLLTEWVNGNSIDIWDRGRLQKFFAAGTALLEAGLFEWDFSPGNLLDDGENIRLFDFGYMYPFDPRRHFNSAGNGDTEPMFHLAERFETRNYFAYLLSLENVQGVDAALAAFRIEKEVVCEAYRDLAQNLARKGATPMVRDWLWRIISDWETSLECDLYQLYLKEGWRSHVLDLDDDLRGETCTSMTLRRCEWLLDTLKKHYADLKAFDAFFWQDRDLSSEKLAEAYQDRHQRAQRHQIVSPAQS